MKKLLVISVLLNLLTHNIYGYDEILELYNNRFPKNIPVKLKYSENLPQHIKYVLIKGLKGNIRELPTTNSEIIKTYPYNTKLKIIEKVNNKYDHIWYKIEGPDGTKGYVSENTVEFREIQFNVMLKKIDELEKFIRSQRKQELQVFSTHSYRPNPNNQNLNWAKDKYGTTIDQSIVGDYKGEKIFIPDKSILSILKEDKENAYVKVASIPDSPLIIKKNHIEKTKPITENFRKVIAIDITNQNFGVFEKLDEKWTLISYVYSKTGMDSKVGFETPRGFFVVPMLRHEMPYRTEEGEGQGYAKYATRFSGGGYIHGTPINYEEEINREFFKMNKEEEMGTFAGTRKCIRTSEEHAKFLFDWILETSKKTTENSQYPKENVMVIVF